MYLKEFEVRWNDLDANRHLANSSYINFMSHTRLSFMMEKGFGQGNMVENHIGPGKPVRVSLELKGISEGGMYFEFQHNFYNAEGINMARCNMMGGWIDLQTRKLRDVPKLLFSALNSLDKTNDFKVLTKEDTRKNKQSPEDL